MAECNTPKQSHNVKYPVELLCNSLCGPLKKKFGDPGVEGS